MRGVKLGAEPARGTDVCTGRYSIKATMSFDPDTWEILRKIAAEEDRPVTYVIRRLVHAGLDARSG